MTIGCTAVAIYFKGNLGLKIFDSHARDIYGRSHPQGTCVLPEVSSLNSLVHYFQSIRKDDMFELKVVKINKVQNSTLFQSHACETRKFNVSCAVAIYSLCYSVMKSCSYWNSNTPSSLMGKSNTRVELQYKMATRKKHTQRIREHDKTKYR